MERRHIAILPIVIALLFMALKFCSAEKVTNPLTGKTARVGLSSEQEQALGLQSYQEVLSQARVVTSGPEYDEVVRVARRLTSVTGSAAKDFQWEVSLVQSPEVNA